MSLTFKRFSPSAVTTLLIFAFAGIAHAQKESPVETVSIIELRQKALDLNGKTVRVKYHYRGNIAQLDAERYYVRLYDKDYNQLWVEFPKEALNAFKKLPTDEKYSATRTQYMFGTIRAPDATGAPAYFYSGTYLVPVIMDALGTNVSKNISGVIKYVW